MAGLKGRVNLEFDGQTKITVQTIERLLPSMIQTHMGKDKPV